MTRSLKPLRLTDAPLICVLCQVRISPILEMNNFIPAIQERLRRQGYPRFKAHNIQEFVMTGPPEVRTSHQWVFSNKDQTKTVIVAPDFVVLETSKYTVFDEFIQDYEKVLEIVGEVTDASLAERVGLRYVDLIRPLVAGDFKSYIKPGLLGLSDDSLKVKRSLFRFEQRGSTDAGTLVLKLMQSDNGAYLPNDVDANHLEFDLTLEEGEKVAILDIDHFSQASRDYDPGQLVKQLWELHDYTDRVFREAVTEEALKQWGAESR
ncbi:MAG: TIGR04255 family protein [Myxococcales bacterium]|nr:TIGR04255 family protein [Myxococcales bacterium]